MDNVNQPRGHSKRLRWGAGITAALLLGAGGLLGGLKLGDSATPAGAAQATVLNTALNSPAAGCARGTSSTSAATSATSGRRHCRRLSLRRIKGMYGEIALHVKDGTKTLAFERGTVVASSASRLEVRALNGTEWAWDLGRGAAVRERGKAVPSGALTTGARVFVGGEVVGGTRDARLIVIRAAPAAPGSSAGSGSAA